MPKSYLTKQTDTGTNKGRLARAVKERDARYRQNNAGSMSRRPASVSNIKRSQNQTNEFLAETTRVKGGTPLTDTQKAYISAAHKPNTRIGVKPVKPSKSKFVKKPL